jgi:hypothetical protein
VSSFCNFVAFILDVYFLFLLRVGCFVLHVSFCYAVRESRR